MTDSEINNILGERIKKARIKAHLTQAELAEKIDVSPNFIGMIERGERNTKFPNIYKIILALEYNLETFFKGL